jgi:hypothetical protein
MNVAKLNATHPMIQEIMLIETCMLMCAHMCYVLSILVAALCTSHAMNPPT